MTPDQFQETTGVSRETLDRFRAYEAVLAKWQKRINLVGPKTLPDVWNRHFYDSAQLYPLLPETTETLVDFGSGAGFPGLVMALMGVPDVHLIESDGRKAAFLREAARAAGVSVTVHNKRIEDVENIRADVITARALAPIKDLLTYASGFLKTETICIFLKGKRIEEELTDANYLWHIKHRRIPSRSDDDGAILFVEGFTDVRQTSGAGDQAE